MSKENAKEMGKIYNLEQLSALAIVDHISSKPIEVGVYRKLAERFKKFTTLNLNDVLEAIGGTWDQDLTIDEILKLISNKGINWKGWTTWYGDEFGSKLQKPEREYLDGLVWAEKPSAELTLFAALHLVARSARAANMHTALVLLHQNGHESVKLISMGQKYPNVLCIFEAYLSTKENKYSIGVWPVVTEKDTTQSTSERIYTDTEFWQTILWDGYYDTFNKVVANRIVIFSLP